MSIVTKLFSGVLSTLGSSGERDRLDKSDHEQGDHCWVVESSISDQSHDSQLVAIGVDAVSLELHALASENAIKLAS